MMNHLKNSSWRLASLLTVLLVAAPAAEAWHAEGHHTVAAIAWDNLSDSPRRTVVELLLEAPADSDIAWLMPPGPRSWEARARELFINTSMWADIVRDEGWPAREEKYNEPTWHYVNHFWEQTPEGPERLEEMGTSGELVKRLAELRVSVIDASRPVEERAIDLAWILHLVGDVHQPLHDSSRVTELEPEGDRGGNDFLLDHFEMGNLHAYWDGILRLSRRQYHTESHVRWVKRLAAEFAAETPRGSLSTELREQDHAKWALEGLGVAMTVAYPESLARNSTPSGEYRQAVFEATERAVPLAGYRLAELLDDLFDQ